MTVGLTLKPRRAWRLGAALGPGERALAEETPVALVHDGATTAVMLATPANLEDFGLGFSLTEGVIAAPDDIRDLEVIAQPQGVEVRMWLARGPSGSLAARRRRLAGPTGCGLCGVESLAEAIRPPRRVAAGGTIAPAVINQALSQLAERQALGSATRAVHAAGFWTLAAGVTHVREDVGRHNALDKLAGALARAGADAAAGAIILTSRVSVEMVQKAAAIGAPILIAVSAPTTLAVSAAEAAGLTLIAVARADGFEVFSGAERVAS